MFDLEIKGLNAMGLNHAKIDIGLPSPNILYSDINQQDCLVEIEDGFAYPILLMNVNVVLDDVFQTDEAVCDFVDLLFLVEIKVTIDLKNQKVASLECIDMIVESDDSSCYRVGYENEKVDFSVLFSQEFLNISDFVCNQIEEKAIINYDIR